MNSVILQGRLTNDVDSRVYNQNMIVTRFNIAVDKKLSKEKKATMEQQGKATADFINCMAFGKVAEVIEKYFKKGDPILIRGRVQTGKYQKDDGSTVYTTDIVVDEFDFIGGKKENKVERKENYNKFGIDDDEIPF